jgi:hypothetical protein
MPIVSYPTTFEDLRASFLALHPDYEFGLLVFKNWADVETKYHVPKEPIGGTSVWGDSPSSSSECRADGCRFQEWLNYIYNQIKLIAAEANITTLYTKEADVLPRRMIGDGCEPPPIFRLIRVEDAYVQLCHNPEITPAKRLTREQAREAKIYLEQKRKEELVKAKIYLEQKQKEELVKARKRREIKIAAEKKRYGEELYLAREWAIITESKIHMGYSLAKENALINAYRGAMMCSKKITSLAAKHSLTEQEAEAILAHLDPSSQFKKDTLLALKIFNRFATEHGIRVENAITIFREYAL